MYFTDYAIRVFKKLEKGNLGRIFGQLNENNSQRINIDLTRSQRSPKPLTFQICKPRHCFTMNVVPRSTKNTNGETEN